MKLTLLDEQVAKNEHHGVTGEDEVAAERLFTVQRESET